MGVTPPVPDPGRAAILGGGARGAHWTARFLAAGWEVALFDPDPDAAATVLSRLAARVGPAANRLRNAPLISDAVADALWIGDCAPDRLALKRKLYQQVQAHCRPDAVIAAATTAFAVDALQSCATRPGQILAVIGLHTAPPATRDPGMTTVLAGKFSASGHLNAALAILHGLGLPARISPDAGATPAPQTD